MRRHLDGGLAAAEAAALASREPAGEARPSDGRRLRPVGADGSRRALDAFDEPRAQALIDGLLAVDDGRRAARGGRAAVPARARRALGARRGVGRAGALRLEHPPRAAARPRARLGTGLGPLALLACLPGEQHDLGLIAFGLALRARGWRVAYLGPDTPLDTLDAAAGSLAPALVVVTASTRTGSPASPRGWPRLADRYRVGLGGSGAADGGAPDGPLVLAGDPVVAADDVTAVAAR